MKAKNIIGNILIFLAAAFTIYLSIIMIHRIRTVVLKDSYVKVFRYELVACALFILFALDFRFGFFTKPGPVLIKAVGWVLRIIVILGTAALLFFMGKITVGSLIRTEAPAQHAIVLGLALEDGKPTADLLSRVDTAEKYAAKNPDSILILTGGNPDDAGRTEAAVMRDLLAGRGIAENRMLLEDQAETTKENFANTARLINPDEPVVLISSNYHMDRAVQEAGKTGFSRIHRLPAPSSVWQYPANVMWEVVMELNELTLKEK